MAYSNEPTTEAETYSEYRLLNIVTLLDAINFRVGLLLALNALLMLVLLIAVLAK